MHKVIQYRMRKIGLKGLTLDILYVDHSSDGYTVE